jgi:hypothetical protein
MLFASDGRPDFDFILKQEGPKYFEIIFADYYQ